MAEVYVSSTKMYSTKAEISEEASVMEQDEEPSIQPGQTRLNAWKEPQINTSDNENYDEECPLFMNSLPRNFQNSRGLAAIATFLGGEVPEEEIVDSVTEEQCNIQDNSIKTKSSGKSLKKTALKKKSSKKKHSTCKVDQKLEKQAGPTIEEAQLYLKMWDIN